MNAKPNYKTRTRNDIILSEHMDGLVTNLAFETLDHPRTYKEKARQMEEEGVLKKSRAVLDRRVITVYSLNHYEETKKEYESVLPDGYYETYVTYMAEEGKSARKSEKMRAERAIGNANTSFIMEAAGICRSIDEKPRLMDEGKLNKSLCAYYTARELKWFTGFTPDVSVSREGKKKVLNSRINGLAITPGGLYPTYYIGPNVEEWKRGTEIKMKVHLEGMVGKKMDDPRRINNVLLFTTAYPKLGNLIGGTEIQNDSIMQLAGMYESVIVLPYTKEGRKMLSLMSRLNWKEDLYATYGKKYVKGHSETYSVRSDGYSPEEDSLLCLFLDCDVRKLDTFTSYAKAVQDKTKFTVICFDWQKDVVIRTCGGACRILTTQFDHYYREIQKTTRL